MGLSSNNRTEPIMTFCGKNSSGLLNVRTRGEFSDHWASKAQ